MDSKNLYLMNENGIIYNNLIVKIILINSFNLSCYFLHIIVKRHLYIIISL